MSDINWNAFGMHATNPASAPPYPDHIERSYPIEFHNYEAVITVKEWPSSYSVALINPNPHNRLFKDTLVAKGISNKLANVQSYIESAMKIAVDHFQRQCIITEVTAMGKAIAEMAYGWEDDDADLLPPYRAGHPDDYGDA